MNAKLRRWWHACGCGMRAAVHAQNPQPRQAAQAGGETAAQLVILELAARTSRASQPATKGVPARTAHAQDLQRSQASEAGRHAAAELVDGEITANTKHGAARLSAWVARASR